MGWIERAVGLGRSLAIYHGIPLRQRRMRRLYSNFVGRGDLVFDIGAHAGNRVRALAAIGCRVVAVEPQPDFARLLRWGFGRSTQVEIVEAAVAEANGRALLAMSERTPTVTTIARTWQEARAKDTDFGGVRWTRQVEVSTTSLDALIRRFGVPAFVKIDVEGAEPQVLAGLSQPVSACSFEYLPRALDQVEACLARLAVLGQDVFNWSRGETYTLSGADWLDRDELLRHLRREPRSGDVYARLESRRGDP